MRRSSASVSPCRYVIVANAKCDVTTATTTSLARRIFKQRLRDTGYYAVIACWSKSSSRRVRCIKYRWLAWLFIFFGCWDHDGHCCDMKSNLTLLNIFVTKKDRLLLCFQSFLMCRFSKGCQMLYMYFCANCNARVRPFWFHPLQCVTMSSIWKQWLASPKIWGSKCMILGE